MKLTLQLAIDLSIGHPWFEEILLGPHWVWGTDLHFKANARVRTNFSDLVPPNEFSSTLQIQRNDSVISGHRDAQKKCKSLQSRLMNKDEYNDDPFPISLPHILDTDTTAMGDAAFDIGTICGKSQMYSSPSYQDPPRVNVRDTANFSSYETMSNESPDSFPDSWSSSSSHLQHKRNDSAESSQSGLLEDDGGAAMKMSYSPLPKGIAVHAYPIADSSSHERSPSTDLDASNEVMASHFDFDGAASNSNEQPDVSQISSTGNGMPPGSVKQNGIDRGCGAYHKRLKVRRPLETILMM